MGTGTNPLLAAQQKRLAEEQKLKLRQLEAKDEAESRALTAKLQKELETEIEKWRKIREEQLRQRRVATEQAEAQAAATAPPKELPLTSRPKRGMFGNWGRRIKSAQQQAQPETAGKRVGG